MLIDRARSLVAQSRLAVRESRLRIEASLELLAQLPPSDARIRPRGDSQPGDEQTSKG
jgi:hypothetical protein